MDDKDGLTVLKDGFISDDEDDEDDDVNPIPIYHLTLEDFYPTLSVQILRRSMGLNGNPRPTVSPISKLQKISHYDLVQVGDVKAAGNWRDHIMLGCRKTWPFSILTVYRGTPSEVTSVKSIGSIAFWKLDVSNLTVSMVHRPEKCEIIEQSGQRNQWVNCSILSTNSAWDILRDCLVQVISLQGQTPTYEAQTSIRLIYGDCEIYIDENGTEEPVSCLCGTGCIDPNDRSIRVATSKGIYCYFPFANQATTQRLPFYCTRMLDIFRNLYYIDVATCSRRSLAQFFARNKNSEVEQGLPDDLEGQIIILSPPIPRSHTPATHSQFHSSLKYSHIFPSQSKVDLFIITYDMDVRISSSFALKVTSRRKVSLSSVYEPLKLTRQDHRCADCAHAHHLRFLVPYSYEKSSVASMCLEELGVVISDH